MAEGKFEFAFKQNKWWRLLTVRTGFLLLQTSFRYVPVHDRLIAAVTSVRAYVVFRAVATTHAILVTAFAQTVVIILGGWTLWHAVWAIARVFAFLAMLGVRPRTRASALLVTHLAGLFIRSIDSKKKSMKRNRMKIIISLLACKQTLGKKSENVRTRSRKLRKPSQVFTFKIHSLR